MARTTLIRAVEAKIRDRIKRNNTGMLWLLQEYRSPEEGLVRLSVADNNVHAGRTIKRCIAAAKSGPHPVEAIDLLVWMYVDTISRYCSNIGSWYRKDAEQEGLLAIIEVAKNFKTYGCGERYIRDSFRKAVIRHVRAVRKEERLQVKISNELLAFINLGFQAGENADATSRQSIRSVDVNEHNEVVALLRETVDAATLNSGLDPWVLRHLHGQSIARCVKEDVDADESLKATAKMQRRALRLHRRLRKIFKNHGLQMVAVESLGLAGKTYNDSVPMVSLRASNGDEVLQDRWTINKA